MKTFFLRSLIVLAALVVLDMAVGFVGSVVVKNVPDTDVSQANAKSALMDKTSDVLILGASKASRNYVPELFNEHFGLNTYNGGRDGNDILYSYAVLRDMNDRHPLKMVILDITMMQLDGSYFSVFLPEYKCYYGRDKYITEVIDRIATWNERVKLVSNLFRYNGTIPWLGLSYFKGGKSQNDGYMPLFGGPGEREEYKGTTEDITLPELYMTTFRELSDYCKSHNIDLYVCYSPSLESLPDELHSLISNVCRDNGIPYLNYNNAPDFIGSPDLFKDYNHMNDSGARLFTQTLLKEFPL